MKFYFLEKKNIKKFLKNKVKKLKKNKMSILMV